MTEQFDEIDTARGAFSVLAANTDSVGVIDEVSGKVMLSTAETEDAAKMTPAIVTTSVLTPVTARLTETVQLSGSTTLS